jgi:hypothetical protein
MTPHTDIVPSARAITLRLRDGRDRAVVTAEEARQIAAQLQTAAQLVEHHHSGRRRAGARLRP